MGLNREDIMLCPLPAAAAAPLIMKQPPTPGTQSKHGHDKNRSLRRYGLLADYYLGNYIATKEHENTIAAV